MEHPDDNMLGLSKNDEEFMKIVSSGIKINEAGNIQIPLPFKPDATPPERKQAVYYRSKNTLERIAKDPEKAVKCKSIIDEYLKKGHVKQLTNEEADLAKHFIPVFPFHTSRNRWYSCHVPAWSKLLLLRRAVSTYLDRTSSLMASLLVRQLERKNFGFFSLPVYTAELFIWNFSAHLTLQRF